MLAPDDWSVAHKLTSTVQITKYLCTEDNVQHLDNVPEVNVVSPASAYSCGQSNRKMIVSTQALPALLQETCPWSQEHCS